jgi:hypothetical protein
MANIWQDIEIDWNDKTYTVKPTIDFINHLESGAGRSLSNLLIRLSNSDMPSAISCEIIAKTLNYGGANKVTPEDVYMATNGGMSADAIQMSASILMACLPKPKEEAFTGASKKKKPARK